MLWCGAIMRLHMTSPLPPFLFVLAKTKLFLPLQAVLKYKETKTTKRCQSPQVTKLCILNSVLMNLFFFLACKCPRDWFVFSKGMYHTSVIWCGNLTVLKVVLIDGFHIAVPYYKLVCFFRMLCPCTVG